LKREDLKTARVALTEKRETTGPTSQIRLTAERKEINADGEDVAILTIEALDKQGRAVRRRITSLDSRFRERARCWAWATATRTARKATRSRGGRFSTGWRN